MPNCPIIPSGELIKDKDNFSGCFGFFDMHEDGKKVAMEGKS